MPLRPLTVGEVLDAAVALLRARAARLLLLGAAVATIEQAAVLYPLRVAAHIHSSYFDALTVPTAAFGQLVVAGLATEAFGIALLSAVAARGAVPVAGRRGRWFSVVAGALVTAVACAATGWLFLLPVWDDPLVARGLIVLFTVGTAIGWSIVYGLAGGITAAVVVDDVGAARGLGRSIVLAGRLVLRGAVVRVLGYGAWLLVRVALWLALLYGLDYLHLDIEGPVMMGIVWAFVNAIGYPVLACLNVSIHVDARVRTEGLDIAVNRAAAARARGVAPAIAAWDVVTRP